MKAGSHGPDQPAWAAARNRRASQEHETRSLLLEAAARVFADNGYSRTTVADITAVAQVSRPAFYAYFASKDEIFIEVATMVRDEFLAAHELPGIEIDNSYDLARTSTRAFLAAYASNFALLTVIEHQAIGDERVRAIWDEIQQRPVRRMVRYVFRLASEGQAEPAASPELVANAMLGMFARVASNVPSESEGFERLVDEMTAIYLRLIGLSAPNDISSCL